MSARFIMAKLIKFYQKNIRERKDHLIAKGDITSQDADFLHESTSVQIHNVNRSGCHIVNK